MGRGEEVSLAVGPFKFIGRMPLGFGALILLTSAPTIPGYLESAVVKRRFAGSPWAKYAGERLAEQKK